MNCPYCDESTHPLAKFCSKCGLPLKEDATVMGAYATDDTGPSPWVVGGGAVAIVAIALTLGWLGSRKNDARPTETVRRDSIGGFPAPPAPAATSLPGYTGFSAAAAPARRTGPSATYNPSVRYAWTPPPRPQTPPRVNWRPEPVPPPIMLASINPIIYRRPAVVEPPRLESPAVPPLPPDVAAAAMQAGLPTGGQPTGFDGPQVPAGFNYVVAPNGEVGVLNGNGVFESLRDRQPLSGSDSDQAFWVWDPVHERWAVQTDRKRSRARRVGGEAVSADAGG